MPQDGTTAQSRQQFKVVGTRPLRPDGIDKVTGKARFGADMYMPGMLYGLVLRSPHAHARIKGIDAAAALALDGVKAVLTSADLPDHSDGDQGLRDALENVMARRKALYDGHPVAAVAATSLAIARQALKLIQVDYEVLPHVTDVEAAMAADAPILHDHIFTEGVQPKPKKAIEHRLPTSVRPRRSRQRLQGCGRGHRAHVPHRGRPPGLHRAARLPRPAQGRRLGRDLVLHAGALHGAQHVRLPARPRHLAPAGDGLRDRRRLRRQDRRIPRAARARAFAQGRPAGEDGDEPRGGVPRQRPDGLERDARQDRYQEGRAAHRRRCRAEIPGRRLSGLAGRHGRHGGVRLLRVRERARRRLRRRVQPAQARRLPGAERADRRIRGRERDRRAGGTHRHGPAGAAPQERRQGGHASRPTGRPSSASA